MFVNTRYFSEAAIDFEKNKGKYTLAPKGSKDWWDFWEEQERRCLQGYKVGDVKITGRHYAYLNFGRVKLAKGKDKVARKVWGFPKFWEIDYNWWWYKEIAWYGCTPEFLEKLNLWRRPSYLGGARHLSCLKTRRAGFSFKEAFDGVYNYNFFDGSHNYYFAGDKKYLVGDDDGIIDKCLHGMDWLNQQTDGFWLKNRMKKSSLSDLEFVASYIDNVDKQEKGTKSVISGIIVDDPNKVRGKDGLKATYEEGGSFKHLKEALAIMVPALRSGTGTLTGQMSIFGTGGEEGEDIEGLDEIFNDPYTYDMLPFVNDWEEGFEATECGVFVPCYMADPTFMDADGNIDMKGAIAADDVERAKAKGAKDPKKLDKRIAEHPRTPTEALIRVNYNDFPVQQAIYQMERVRRTSSIKDALIYCDLIKGESGVEIVVKDKAEAKPVDYYPHRKDDDLRSCVVIGERPEYEKDGKVLDGKYYIVVDPFYDEDAEDKTSLGAVYVFKRTLTQDIMVAWFTGRPRLSLTFHEIIFNLSFLYNAKIQSEIAGGGKGILDYAKVIKHLDRLEFAPIKINNQEIEVDKKNKKFFMTLNTDDKVQGLTYLNTWLRTPIGLDEDGNELWNIHFVYDLGFLQEIIKFSHSRNCDRISANIVAQYQMRERRGTPIGGAKKKRTRLINKEGVFGGPRSGRQDHVFDLKQLLDGDSGIVI